jgi:hypothetical protein
LVSILNLLSKALFIISYVIAKTAASTGNKERNTLIQIFLDSILLFNEHFASPSADLSFRSIRTHIPIFPSDYVALQKHVLCEVLVLELLIQRRIHRALPSCCSLVLLLIACSCIGTLELNFFVLSHRSIQLRIIFVHFRKQCSFFFSCVGDLKRTFVLHKERGCCLKMRFSLVPRQLDSAMQVHVKGSFWFVSVLLFAVANLRVLCRLQLVNRPFGNVMMM